MVEVLVLNCGAIYATVLYQDHKYGVLTAWLRNIQHNYAMIERHYLTTMSRMD